MAYQAPVSTSMLTVESPSEVGIVVLCDILEATRSQGDDLQVCLRQNGGDAVYIAVNSGPFPKNRVFARWQALRHGDTFVRDPLWSSIGHP